MAKRKRDISAFSMSFLDCICCGFGAIILLFVLSKSGEPVVIEQVSEDLSSVLARLEKEVSEIRGETAILNRDLEGKVEQLSAAKEKLAHLQGDLSDIKGAFSGSASDATVQNKIEGTLAEARQDLTEEM
ncbi:MAG: VWA domain-containing protein, partial [Verrucomicrobiota bacterium]